MTNIKNVDDLLNGFKTETPETEEIKSTAAEETSESGETPSPKSAGEQNEPEVEAAAEGEDYLPSTESKKGSDVKASEEKQEADTDVDEYGNPIQKSRMYSEDEVQKMIRDRLSRITPQQQDQVKEAAQDFKADPNNPETWEAQLEKFVESTINKVTKRQYETEWKQKEQQKQADFESKFSLGMQKYKDFHETVRDMPITDAMMIAAREMKDPAAFIYAAAKLHGAEIKRIAGLPNAMQQAVEIGKLEEKMKKARNLTRASKPLTPTKSDTAVNYKPKYSIDQLISKHAKSKVR